MPQLSRIVLTTLTFVLLCLGAAAVTRADTITLTGSRSATNIPPAAPNIGRCGAAPNLLISGIMGAGTSNLGAFTTAESTCVNPVTGILSNGLFTFDFANGSTLFGTTSGLVILPPINGIAPNSLTFIITGGTGLFAGATGSLLVNGQVTFLPGGFTNNTFNFNGTITTVPEPTTLLLLGTGLAGVVMKARRGRKLSAQAQLRKPQAADCKPRHHKYQPLRVFCYSECGNERNEYLNLLATACATSVGPRME